MSIIKLLFIITFCQKMKKIISMYGKRVSVKAELKDMLAMYCSDSGLLLFYAVELVGL